MSIREDGETYGRPFIGIPVYACRHCQDTQVLSGGAIPCPYCYEIPVVPDDFLGPDHPDHPGDALAGMTNAERKECAVSRGLFAYFPDALALIARHSVRSNEKHNPGEPIHWSREKSTDHEDCIGRHSIAVAANPDAQDDGQYEIICRAWRALAAAQLWAEAKIAKGEKI